MTTKRPRKPKAKPPSLPLAAAYTPNRSLPLTLEPGDTPAQHGRKIAKQIMAPETAAYRVLNSAEGEGPMAASIDGAGMLAALRATQKAVNDGDLSTAEAMLMAQAVGLQALYVRLTERAMGQQCIPHMETFMRLALKAQAQSRLALEALAALKQGPAILARNAQVNVAHGPQQVNNAGAGAMEPARAQSFEIAPNQVLAPHGCKDVDAGTTRGPSAGDMAVASLGKRHGAKD
jgi:hypothetical protein